MTPKQQAFVREYLIDLNATQAAIRAGYSKRNADKIGSELLGKTRVDKAVQEGMDKRAEKVSLEAEDVLKSIIRLGVKAEEADRYNEALRAQELLGKHLKMFTDKFDHSSEDGSMKFPNVIRLVGEDG